MKRILLMLLAAVCVATVAAPAQAGQTGGDVKGCPDDGYRITQQDGYVRVYIKYVRRDFPITFRFDGVTVAPRWGDLTFVDPEGNDDYTCFEARFRVANTGHHIRIGEDWYNDGLWDKTGGYRVR